MTTTREIMIGTSYATSCSGTTKLGRNCKRNTYVLVNGDPFCSAHEEQATAKQKDNITPEQAEALYAEYGIK